MNSIGYYLINLDDNEERLFSAASQLRIHSIEFERISAFDGRCLDLGQFEQYDRGHALSYMGRELVGGEIGCYISHMRCAEAFLKSGKEFCVVLEDDFKIDCPDFSRIIADTLNWLETTRSIDWLLINIGNERLKLSTPIYKSRCSRHILHLAHYFPMTTTGLIWSRRGAELFLRNSNSIFAPVDNYFRYWLTRQGGGLSFSPPLISTTSAPSTIDAAVRRTRQKRAVFHGLIKQKRLWVDKFLAIGKKYFTAGPPKLK
jgi:glycosyl transferase family 25